MARNPLSALDDFASEAVEGIVVDKLEKRPSSQQYVAQDPKAIDERIRGAENRVFEKAMRAIEETQDAREIDPAKQDEGPPQDWIDAMGREEAEKKFRVACAGWMSAKNAPVFLKQATEIVAGIIKARAMAKTGPQTLNVQIIKFPGGPAMDDYPVIEVEDEQGRTGRLRD